MFVDLEQLLTEQDFRTNMEDMATDYMSTIAEEDSISSMLSQESET